MLTKHSIKISDDSYRRLKELGSHGETFEDIIQKLLPVKAGNTKKGVRK